MVYEEKFISKYNVPALQAVGWEGKFYLVILIMIVTILSLYCHYIVTIITFVYIIRVAVTEMILPILYASLAGILRFNSTNIHCPSLV